MAAETLCCTSSVALGQRAFANHNGIGISLAYAPQPPSPGQLQAQGPPAAPAMDQLQPPPMIAVVLDASMQDTQLQAATQAVTQAMGQLSPQTRLLLLVVDQVVTAVDLKTPLAQTWVLHGLGSSSAQGPAVLPQLVQAADIRATPLAHCQPFLAASLASVRHYPRQHQSLEHHLQIMASAADIALFLLTASMAAWDGQHRQQPQQQHQDPRRQQQQQQEQQHLQQMQAQLQQPPHNARVMVLTGLPSSSCPSAAHARELLQLLDEQAVQRVRAMYAALGAKASSLDIPVDVITSSLAAPAALLLQDVAARSLGQCLHQPQMRPPLAANIAAIAQSRFGYEAVIDLQLPPGLKLLQLSGPVAAGAASERLPSAAQLSGTTALPITLVLPPGHSAATAAAAGAAVAAAKDFSSAQEAPGGNAAAAGRDGAAAAARSSTTGSMESAAGHMKWSSAAVAVPVLSKGSRFVAALELARDLTPGSKVEVKVVCEWTAADGRRIRQVSSHTIKVADRLGPFIDALDVPAVVLLLSQRLVGTAAAAIAGGGSAAGGSTGSSLGLAALPSKRAVEEGRLAAGMALAHVAQRLGHAHVSRKGLFGFGAQQVYQLPDELIPLALSLYQLQRGQLLNPEAAAAADEAWGAISGSSTATGGSSDGGATTPRAGIDGQPVPLSCASWRLLVQQFMHCGPGTALRMVAPWLYVYDPTSNQFDVLPPLNLALEPDALAVLDCGSQVIIYVGKVLVALVEGLTAPNDTAAEEPAGGGGSSTAPGSGAAAANGDTPHPPGQPPAANGNPLAAGGVPDMAEAAAPAVRCAQHLIRGRVPVPAIHIVEDTGGMVDLVRRLVPLHADPMALQLLLLPHLRDLSPAQHGYLMDWHRHWAAAAADAAGGGGQQGGGVRAGGARLAAAEASEEELSFGAWYSSFGVVLKSPAGALAAAEEGHNEAVE